MLTVAILALGVAGGAGRASAAGAPNVKCHSGDILTGVYKNVLVPPGNFCLLLGATVLENVLANNSTQLGIDNSRIGGNVLANNVSDNGWVCGSTIGHNLEVANASQSTAEPGAWFIGDASWCIAQFDPVPGNYIGGNLGFHNNESGGFISNNDIERNLTCENNSPPPTGANNSVDGNATGQCAGMGGGVDDSLSPTDSD